MQRLEVSGAVRPLKWSLGVKGLIVSINQEIQAVLKKPRFIFTVGDINSCSYRSHVTPTSDQMNFEVQV